MMEWLGTYTLIKLIVISLVVSAILTVSIITWINRVGRDHKEVNQHQVHQRQL